MAEKEKFIVLAIEPVLDDRKDIANLFQSNHYKLTFVDSIKEAAQFINNLIPHFVLINIDQNPKNIIHLTKSLLDLLPNETVKLCSTKDLKSKNSKAINKLGINEFFEKPLRGINLFEKIKMFKFELKELSVEIKEKIVVSTQIEANIIGLSETDFIIETGLVPQIDEVLTMECPLIEGILSEQKRYIVTPNKHEHLSSTMKFSTITMLGLRNEDLQSIRAKILHWEKL
jgi:response regulator RpfG family c-di-GMP phosphodiesterase